MVDISMHFSIVVTCGERKDVKIGDTATNHLMHNKQQQQQKNSEKLHKKRKEKNIIRIKQQEEKNASGHFDT